MLSFFTWLRRGRWLLLLSCFLTLAVVVPEHADAARRKRPSQGSRSSKRSYKKSGRAYYSKSKGRGGRAGRHGSRRGRRGGRSYYAPSFAVPAIGRGFSTVIVDAGHGGHDHGGVPWQRISEKEMTLDTAQRLASYLRNRGLRVIMTRTDDSFVGLGERVRVANATSNSIFVSIHYNSAPNLLARGFETYYFHAAGYPLAYRIHRNLLSTIPNEDRGLRRRGFYVIRGTRIPSVLCELGYLTNAQEGSEILSRSRRQALAEAVGRAIVETRREGG